MNPSGIISKLLLALPLTAIALGPVFIVGRLIESILQGKAFTMDCVMAALGTAATLVIVAPMAWLSGNHVEISMSVTTYVEIAATYAGVAGLLFWRKFRSA